MHSSSGRQRNFAVLNRGRHLYSAVRLSRCALAHNLAECNQCHWTLTYTIHSFITQIQPLQCENQRKSPYHAKNSRSNIKFQEFSRFSRSLGILYVQICYFVTVLRMTYGYLHSLPTSVQYEIEEKSIWRQKRGRARKKLYRRFQDNHFPGQTFSGQDVSRTRLFPDNHFPGQRFPRETFPGQVILRNFHLSGKSLVRETSVR